MDGLFVSSDMMKVWLLHTKYILRRYLTSHCMYWYLLILEHRLERNTVCNYDVLPLYRYSVLAKCYDTGV